MAQTETEIVEGIGSDYAIKYGFSVTEDYFFDGVHHVGRHELVERVPALEGANGWAMVFSAGADTDHVDSRTAEMVSLAEKRIEMISRIAARKQS